MGLYFKIAKRTWRDVAHGFVDCKDRFRVSKINLIEMINAYCQQEFKVKLEEKIVHKIMLLLKSYARYKYKGDIYNYEQLEWHIKDKCDKLERATLKKARKNAVESLKKLTVLETVQRIEEQCVSAYKKEFDDFVNS